MIAGALSTLSSSSSALWKRWGKANTRGYTEKVDVSTMMGMFYKMYLFVCVCESTFFSLHHTHTYYVYVMSYKLSRHTRPACSVDFALAQPCHKPQSQKVWLPAHKCYSAGRGTCGQAGWRVDWVNTFYRPAQLGDNLWNEAKWSEIKINFICA